MAKPKSRRRKVKRLVAEDGTVLTEEEIERMADGPSAVSICPSSSLRSAVRPWGPPGSRHG
jgi:hypothetical protein